ncbi:hypothetical protein Efla_004074 [Eimeria flavescens]
MQDSPDPAAAPAAAAAAAAPAPAAAADNCLESQSPATPQSLKAAEAVTHAARGRPPSSSSSSNNNNNNNIDSSNNSSSSDSGSSNIDSSNIDSSNNSSSNSGSNSNSGSSNSDSSNSGSSNIDGSSNRGNSNSGSSSSGSSSNEARKCLPACESSSSSSSSGNSSSSSSSNTSKENTETAAGSAHEQLAAYTREKASSSSNGSSSNGSLGGPGSSSKKNGGAASTDGRSHSHSSGSSSTSSSMPCERPSSVSSSLSRCSSSHSDLDELIEGFYRSPPVLLSEADLWFVCQRVKELLLEESNVQPVPAPVVVCGDIHGQLHDLLLLLHVAGSLPATRYVFLGDYVDRGRNSVETFELLMLMKLKHPSRVTLLRGNHETRQITTVYGFYDECLRKYGNANAWRFCCEVFDYLTLSALIEGSIFCVHGGLSPQLHLLDQLQLIHRVREIPTEGAFGDIVWSDPEEVSDWQANPRGAGWLFGQAAVTRFNHLNGLDLIARAHQLSMQGFKYSFADASVLTIWSAPNYCYRCGNVAAVLRLDGQLQRQLLVFSHSAASVDADPTARPPVPYFL